MACSTTAAITQYREWSSTPVTIFASRSSPVTASTSSTPPTMSMPHSCIDLGRSNRLNDDFGRFRGRGCASPCRIKIRLIVRSAGRPSAATASATAGASPSRCSSSRIRRAPHRGCARRISTTATSTPAPDLRGEFAGRRDRSARPPIPSARYRPSQVCTDCRETPHPSATSVTVAPASTARTASNRCSTTDNTTNANPASRVQGATAEDAELRLPITTSVKHVLAHACQESPVTGHL